MFFILWIVFLKVIDIFNIRYMKNFCKIIILYGMYFFFGVWYFNNKEFFYFCKYYCFILLIYWVLIIIV